MALGFIFVLCIAAWVSALLHLFETFWFKMFFSKGVLNFAIKNVYMICCLYFFTRETESQVFVAQIVLYAVYAVCIIYDLFFNKSMFKIKESVKKFEMASKETSKTVLMAIREILNPTFPNADGTENPYEIRRLMRGLSYAGYSSILWIVNFGVGSAYSYLPYGKWDLPISAILLATLIANAYLLKETWTIAGRKPTMLTAAFFAAGDLLLVTMKYIENATAWLEGGYIYMRLCIAAFFVFVLYCNLRCAGLLNQQVDAAKSKQIVNDNARTAKKERINR
jgi:hypothetical protein